MELNEKEFDNIIEKLYPGFKEKQERARKFFDLQESLDEKADDEYACSRTYLFCR